MVQKFDLQLRFVFQRCFSCENEPLRCSLLIIYPNPAQGLYRDDAAGKIAGTFVASRDYESNFLLHLSILCNVFFLLL